MFKLGYVEIITVFHVALLPGMKPGQFSTTCFLDITSSFWGEQMHVFFSFFYYFLNHFLDSQLSLAAKTGVRKVTHIILNIIVKNPELNEKHRFFSLIKNS